MHIFLDGLSSELFHIANASKLGFKIFEEKLPIHKDVLSSSKELGVNYLDASIQSLHGSQNYLS